MKQKTICSLAAAVVFFLIFSQTLYGGVTVVKGTLLDVDGHPSKFALVGYASTSNGNAKEFVHCDELGKYSLKLTESGINYLIYSIPSHEAVRVPLRNTKNKTITIDVTLAPYRYKDNFDDLAIYGSFNGFKRQNPEKMVKQDDGTYTYEIKSDKEIVHYQLLGVEKFGRTINLPDAPSYIPDSSGDYHSAANVRDGKVTVVFDPAKLLRKDAKCSVVFRDSKQDERIYSVYQEHADHSMAAMMKMRELQEAKKTNPGIQFDGGDYVRNLPKRIDSEKNTEIRDLLKLAYLSFGRFKPAGYDYGKAKAYFDAVSPVNPAWDLLAEGFFSFYSVYPQYQWTELQDKFLKETKNGAIKTGILMNKLSTAKFTRDENELRRLHALIAADYKDNRELQSALKMFPIDSKVKIGAEIPDFEIASLTNPEEKYSKKGMLGKIYLIDFWATWCGPCVQEMEVLHKAYENYKEKGLEIISLSMDAKSDDVLKFRAAKWSMPWKHGFLGNDNGANMIRNFEVIGVPKPILVSAEGTVLAMDADMRGNALEQTLAKYFK